jgi:hypothetical protein
MARSFLVSELFSSCYYYSPDDSLFFWFFPGETIFLTTSWQLFDNFFDNFFDFYIVMVVASCRNKYDGTNFISAVPTSLLIAPGLRTIQLLFIFFIISNFLQSLFTFFHCFYQVCV